MKDKGSRIDKRKSKQVCLAMVLVFAAMVFCHSCTPPDAVYAAENDVTDSMKQMVIKGPVFYDITDVVEPDQTLEQGGITYHLVSTELSEVSVDGIMTYVSASVPYELEWKQIPPETTIVTLYDQRTESEYKRELSYLDMKETEVLWEKNFSFPITVSGYDSDNFQLGEMIISKDEELIHYADYILESMGLSKEHYQINTIEWLGEPYEREGKMVREAVAEGEKKIRYVDVTYGGEIKTPNMIGYQYISTYEIPEKKKSINKNTSISASEAFVEEANTEESKEGLLEQIRYFLREHITMVTISSLFVLFLIGMIYLWYTSKHRTKKQKSKELT